MSTEQNTETLHAYLLRNIKLQWCGYCVEWCDHGTWQHVTAAIAKHVEHSAKQAEQNTQRPCLECIAIGPDKCPEHGYQPPPETGAVDEKQKPINE